MSRVTIAAMAVAALLLPNAGLAANQNGTFAVKSMGTASCQRYLDARAKADREYVLFAGYLGGYVTAYNQLTPGTFDILPWQSVDTLLTMMASYCKQNQQTVLAVAVTNLVKILEPDKLDAPSEMVDAKAGKEHAQIYQGALLRAQKRLAELGYYKGAADGQFNGATRSAFERFQAKTGIPKSGLPDQATLFRLLLTKR